MAAGELQRAQESNLNEDLLGQQMVLQIENPAIDETYFLVGYSRFEIEIVDVRLRAIGGEVICQVTINDTEVTFSEGSTGAERLTGNEIVAKEGDWEQYVADGPTDNQVEVGEAVKLIITDIPTDTGTAGMTFLADIHFRRLRNVT